MTAPAHRGVSSSPRRGKKTTRSALLRAQTSTNAARNPLSIVIIGVNISSQTWSGPWQTLPSPFPALPFSPFPGSDLAGGRPGAQLAWGSLGGRL